MPAVALDTFASTNPAFCALVLRAFTESFQKVDAAGSPIPLLVLPLPLVLSEDTVGFFDGTNTKTGLLTWIGRHPQITIDLPERIVATAKFAREALLFGVTRQVLDVTPQGCIVTADRGLVKRAKFAATDDRQRAFTLAMRLGGWCASVGSIETVYTSLGLHR